MPTVKTLSPAGVAVPVDLPAPPVPPRHPGAPRRPDRLRAWARRHRRWLVAAAAVALLAQMAVAMVTTAVQQTPTIDEPVYIGAAVDYTQRHELRLNPEHPPLGKLIMGVGLAFAEVKVDPRYEGSQELFGRRLLYVWGNDAWRLTLLARLPVIALTLLFGLAVFAFARDLTNAVGGLVALALYALSPDVVAHGSLATLDVPTAGFLLTALWLLWRARRRPARYLPLAGLALGAALATKMSALPAVPVLLGLAAWSVWHATRGRRPPHRVAVGLAAAFVVAVVAVAVVWVAYLAVDPRLRWAAPPDLPVVGELLGAVVDWLPFPAAYRDGMRVQFGFEDREFGGFLFGRAYRGSLWYYLPVVLMIKTPLGALALWAAGAAVLLTAPRLRRAWPYLLLPAAVLLAAATTGARDFGVRYVIVVPILMAVVAAAVVRTRQRRAHAVTAAMLALVGASSLATYPLYLPYSNEAFGGTARTHEHLHDSNVDWGQDLGRLAHHLREHYPGERVWLVYKGSGVPAAYGIHAADPRKVPPDQVRGLLVVSNSRVARPGGRALRHLLETSTPVDQVGHSITIYRR